MTLKYSVAVRNKKLEAFEQVFGTAATLSIRTGPPPANCAIADSGTLLAQINLPNDNMNAHANGQVTKTGAWQDTSANATGVAGHFRIVNTATNQCVLQGTVGTSGADMIVDTVNLQAGQIFNVIGFTITEGNA